MKRLTVVLILTAALLAGCAEREDVQIIVPKNEGAGVTEKIAGMQASGRTVREQIQPPERYQKLWVDKDFKFSADAPVTVPDVEAIHIKKTESILFTQEDIDLFNRLLEAPPENERDRGVYRWLFDYESLPEELRNWENWNSLVDKTKDMLKTLDYPNMVPASRTWVRRLVGEDILKGDRYAPMIACTKVYDEIPVNYVAVVPKSQSGEWRGQECMHFIFSDEGKVEWILGRNREKVTETSREEVFLLPFSEISQIFEQVVKSSYQEYGTAYGSPYDMCVEMEVDEVKLGYMGIHERQGDSWEEKGKLIPVWDFYGSVSIRYQEESGEPLISQTFNMPDTSLLTINAMDGSVLDRR